MASIVYNSYKKEVLDAGIDHVNDTIKVMLVTSSYTPDQDAHDFKDDITNEVSGTGYTAGGNTLANPTVTVDNVNNKAKFNADNTTWASATITARGAVIYKDTGNAATSPLLCYIDFTTDQSSSNGNFTLNWNAEGIINLN